MILSNPSLQVVRKGERGYKAGAFRLTSPLLFVWDDKKCVVSVPAGFVTDFASIPRGFRNVLSINGSHRLAAVVHDYLYAKSGKVLAKANVYADGAVIDAPAPFDVCYSRKDADKVFKVLMRLEGVSGFVAGTMYRAVRLFGGLHLRLTSQSGWLS